MSGERTEAPTRAVTIRNRAAGVLAGVRHTWMFIGVVLLVILAVESCYRLQGAGRRALRAALTDSVAPPHPYSKFDWFPEFAREEEQSNALVWKPYVYFRRRAFEGRYITVDSLGHRRTVQPPVHGASESVLFFGGSTMFGSPQRDAFTLPSRFAARASALPPRQHQLEMINLGETGYVFTQSVLELELQLREGLRPTVVVFYDGINDVVAGVQSGRGGMPQNEQNRAVEFALGRVLLNWKHDAAAELRAGATLASLGLRRLQIVQGLAARSASAVPQQEVSADSIAVLVATAYVETARLAEALADHYGFKALYVWQPSFHTTQKVYTPFEASLREELEAQPFQMKIRDVHTRAPALVGAQMSQLVGDRFVDATSAFEGDTTSVFVDVIGHTTEAAVDRIVEVIWPSFARLLAAPPPGSRSGS